MMRTMKAAVLHAPGDLRYEEVEIPQISNDEVLIKVFACGICGSDIPRILTTGTYHFPTIPGHEIGGIVYKVGANVDKSLIGKRVAVIPLIPCRSCKLCEVGEFAQCEHYGFLGSRNDGGFAEYVKVPVSNIVIVPEEVDEESVALLEPISVALHAIKNCGVNYGDNVVVYGLGAIGIFIAQWAKAFGASHVFAIDVDQKKVEIAKQVGLVDAMCTEDTNIEASVLEKTDGIGADIVFEASGGGEPVFTQAVAIIRTFGNLGLVGRPMRDITIASKTYEKILRSQITIKGTWSFEFKKFPRHAWEQGLKALKDKQILTKPLITHRFPLSKTFDAVKIMAGKTEFVHKILIEPHL